MLLMPHKLASFLSTIFSILRLKSKFLETDLRNYVTRVLLRHFWALDEAGRSRGISLHTVKLYEVFHPIWRMDISFDLGCAIEGTLLAHDPKNERVPAEK
jgi:hypothetical protein